MSAETERPREFAQGRQNGSSGLTLVGHLHRAACRLAASQRLINLLVLTVHKRARSQLAFKSAAASSRDGRESPSGGRWGFLGGLSLGRSEATGRDINVYPLMTFLILTTTKRLLQRLLNRQEPVIPGGETVLRTVAPAISGTPTLQARARRMGGKAHEEVVVFEASGVLGGGLPL